MALTLATNGLIGINSTVYENCPLPSPEDRLLFILTYVKTYSLQVVQGRLFGMGQSKANQWIHVLLPCLLAALRTLGDAPVIRKNSIIQLGEWSSTSQRCVPAGYDKVRHDSAEPEKVQVSLPLNSIKFMVVGRNERDVQSFRKRQRKGVGKGDAFFDFNASNPLDEYIISIAMECKWQGQRVGPCHLGCGEAVLSEKVIVDFSEITDMHRQKGGGLLNELFEHLGPWLLT